MATVGKVEHTPGVVKVGKQVAVHIVGARYQHTQKEEQQYTQVVATVDHHKYLVGEELVHRNKDQLHRLDVVDIVEEVHGAAQAEEGLQDALNHQDEHDRPQVAVQGLKKSRLVQDWQASHHKGLGSVVLHKKTDHKDQVVESP